MSIHQAFRAALIAKGFTPASDDGSLYIRDTPFKGIDASYWVVDFEWTTNVGDCTISVYIYPFGYIENKDGTRTYIGPDDIKKHDDWLLSLIHI